LGVSSLPGFRAREKSGLARRELAAFEDAVAVEVVERPGIPRARKVDPVEVGVVGVDDPMPHTMPIDRVDWR
jgi:hypothetical protein